MFSFIVNHVLEVLFKSQDLNKIKIKHNWNTDKYV